MASFLSQGDHLVHSVDVQVLPGRLSASCCFSLCMLMKCQIMPRKEKVPLQLREKALPRGSASCVGVLFASDPAEVVHSQEK